MNPSKIFRVVTLLMTSQHKRSFHHKSILNLDKKIDPQGCMGTGWPDGNRLGSARLAEALSASSDLPYRLSSQGREATRALPTATECQLERRPTYRNRVPDRV